MPTRLGAYDVAEQRIKVVYARREFLRQIWQLRKEVLLELTDSTIDARAWAERWRIAVPWIVDWAVSAQATYKAALTADRDDFYERWDRDRAENPAVWFADLAGLEQLCGNVEMLPTPLRDRVVEEA